MIEKNNNQIRLFIKFVRTQFVDDFKNGNLYFDSLDHIHQIEQQTGLSKWGDINDGRRINVLNTNEPNFEVQISPSPNKHLIFTNQSVSNENMLKASFQQSKSKIVYSKYGIACFVVLRQDDFYLVPEHGYRLKISVFQDLIKMQEKSRKMFIISDYKSFLRQLNIFKLKHDFVHYYDNRIFKNFNSDPINELLYQKENKFAYQHEYRVIKDLKNGAFESSISYLKNTYFNFKNLRIEG